MANPYDPATVWKHADKTVVLDVMRACIDLKADHIETLAAFETIIVESGAQNLKNGDLDSLGAFQQRAGWGSAANRENAYKAAVAFLDAARPLRKKLTRSGALAYNVQKCAYAYRNRYSQACAAAKFMRAGAEDLYTQWKAAHAVKPPAPVVVPPNPAVPHVETAAEKEAAAVKKLRPGMSAAQMFDALSKAGLSESHARRTAARAWTRQESAHPTRNRYEECLRTVRVALNCPSGADWAIHAWDAADPRYSHTAKIPEAGTPYFLKGAGKYGHIVLVEKPGHDIRSTTVWSTDIARHGKIDLTTIGHIEDHWGMRGLGWSTNLNGVDI